MSDDRLYRLYKLHQVDARLISIKSQAEHLDLGKREASAFKKLEIDAAPVLGKKKELQQRLTAVEDRLMQTQAKREKFGKELYDGHTTNAREIENLQKEIEMLDELTLTLMEEVQALSAEVEAVGVEAGEVEAKLVKLRKVSVAKRKKAEADHQALTEEFKRVGATRAGVLAEVDADLLRMYDAARKRTGDTGMALITEEGRCGACGVQVAERVSQAVRAGRGVQCESCRRVLFFIMPEVE